MGCVSTKEEGENEKSITRAKSVKMKEILTAALKKSSILKPIVERLSEAELIELVECFQMVVIKGGNYLFKVGEKTDSMYVLTSGKLTVLAANDNILGTVKSAECVGEMGFVNMTQRSASVVASQRSTAYKLSLQDFIRITQSVDHYMSALPLFLNISHEKRMSLSKFAQMATFDADTKIILKGEVDKNLYFLVKGAVSIGPTKIKLNEVFGSEQLLDGTPYSFDVSTDAGATLLVFSELGTTHPDFASLMVNLQRKLKQLKAKDMRQSPLPQPAGELAVGIDEDMPKSLKGKRGAGRLSRATKGKADSADLNSAQDAQNNMYPMLFCFAA